MIPLHIARFDAFVDGCRVGDADFRLFEGAEATPYARCFAVFCMALTRRHALLERDRDALREGLVADIVAMRGQQSEIPTHKGYRQLLTMTLSALSLLDAAQDNRVAALVAEQIPSNLEDDLRRLGCLSGAAQSGNQAMFLAVFLIYAGQYLKMDIQQDLSLWVQLHLQSMNRFGFWGLNAGPTHLHFQNGYHQYEILEYLDEANPKLDASLAAVRSLADSQGHFAPYPGGGGCFDYDAVFVLTPDGEIPDAATGKLLGQTLNTVLSEQDDSGGFCESLLIRPRHKALGGFLGRLLSARNGAVLKERARYALTLQRPKHDQIVTHWSQKHRGWGQADLWDSYFRMLLVARIRCATDRSELAKWGFIDFPGIGWHPSLRKAGHSANLQKVGASQGVAS